ncbi:hypothetical protein ACFPMF_09670 [Larkinella bovis]|uniref:DUF4595 domain-containing protein n=1 Tax=Larkinella bovis TaxID=683041 RepID=A0ABW0IAM4_9BACT
MKTFLRLAFLPIALFVLFDACTLQDHIPSLQEPGCQLRTMTLTAKSSFGERLLKDDILEVDGKQIPIGKERSYEYTYDSQNRLIQTHYLTYTGSSANQRITFDYGPNSVTTKMYNYGSPTPDLEETLPLNAQGLLQKPELFYDSDGYLVADTTIYGPTSYTISGGNIVRMERREAFKGPNGPLTEVQTFEYDVTKLNTPNRGPYKGKSSRNLPIRQTLIIYDGVNPTATFVYEFNYVFDEHGRVIRSYYPFDSYGTTHYQISDYSYTCQ